MIFYKPPFAVLHKRIQAGYYLPFFEDKDVYLNGRLIGHQDGTPLTLGALLTFEVFRYSFYYKQIHRCTIVNPLSLVKKIIQSRTVNSNMDLKSEEVTTCIELLIFMYIAQINILFNKKNQIFLTTEDLANYTFLHNVLITENISIFRVVQNIAESPSFAATIAKQFDLYSSVHKAVDGTIKHYSCSDALCNFYRLPRNKPYSWYGLR